MKKAVLLMVMCLMVIFVLYPIIQAQGGITVTWTHTYPLPPHAVPNDGTDEAKFHWEIIFSPPLKKSCPYTFIILNSSDQSKVVGEELTILAGSSSTKDKYVYPVPKDLPVGWYTAYLNVKETTVIQNFFVGAGNLKILKFLDTNQNGEQDDNERGLSDVNFTIYCPEGDPLDVTTGTDGTYIEHNLMVGKYKVTEQSSRWICTTPPQEPILIMAGKTEEVIFGNIPPNGTLSILKFNDLSNNSIRDPGEEGLEGWEFEIRQDGKLADTCVTDPNGYCNRSLPVGTYTITERLKSGWEATTPNPVVLDVNAGQKTNVEFGNYYHRHGNLSIFKFNDLNNNSRRDPGEGGLEGWEFKIRQDGRLVDTCVTDPNGYCVRSLLEGTYTITERPKSGWWVTSPNPVVLDVNAGQTTDVEFCNHYPLYGNLSIFKFSDLNNNSRRDPGEGGLEGWEFEIRQDGRLVDTCVTDPNGYCVRSLRVGTYTITERPKSGWWVTSPNPVVRDVKAGQTTNVEFGNYYRPPDGNLSIFKFNDLNNNSIRDPEEEGLEGWEFEIRQDGRLGNTCVTDPNGYCVRSLRVGTYTITERLKSGWWVTSPNPVVIEVKAEETTNVEFGNHNPYGNLSIFKFNDSNNNSIRDPEEGGLEGWKFEIRQDGRLVDTGVTDPNGYCNRSLQEGTYKITERSKSGWWVTSPNPIVREVKAGQTTNVEFGNYYPYGNLSIFKFEDLNNNSIRDPGERGLEGWEFEIMQDGRLLDTCVTDPNGYCVRKLLEGRYKITEQQSRCWVSTTPESLEIEVRGGQTTEVEFGNYAIGNLTIQKFYDDNRNKVQEYGEEGLPNWTFTITFPDGSSKWITTGANGTYTLLNVPIGRYTITEEAMTCRWTNSTSTTQYVEVTACQETIASFGNYIADCSIPPGCPWFNEDENLNVSKSVVPCVCNIMLLREGESTSKEGEPEVSVYLRVCVDKRHIKDGIAVENITVVETLYNHFTVVEDSFSEQPRAIKRNPDGTTTMEWDIPSLCCEEWLVSFNATPEYALPIDVTNTSEQVTSKVIYEDPIETGRRELSIPEGKLKFSFIVPPAPLHPICYVLGGLLVISISIEIHLERKRRKKEKSKEKE